MKVITAEGSAPVKAWIDGVELEATAAAQLANMAKLPFIHKHVAVMPDVHWGMGATVGSVIPTVGAIVPAAVGVDLGCGMIAMQTNLRASDLPDNLHGIRLAIEARVPVGRTANGGQGDQGAWPDAHPRFASEWNLELAQSFAEIVEKHPAIAKCNSVRHLGTLGTGNHFIEICLDEQQGVWIMLHSGSRGVGNRIGSYFIERAKRMMEKYYITLPDQDLAYLPDETQDFKDYVQAVSWAQRFAALSRELMLSEVVLALYHELGRSIQCEGMLVNCHHNYIARENHYNKNVWVTRKGAVRAQIGDLGIIPGSMGAKSFIVTGKGNPESFNSCSHGAGRRMSRGQAKRTFTLDDHAEATRGVECRKDASVLDETPGAYKDIDAVMAAQADLVSIVHTLRQVVCVKG